MEFPFVGRRREFEGLKRLNGMQQPFPIVVYGPEGCGKTRLFREAVRRFRRWFGDGVAYLLDAQAGRVEELLGSSAGEARADLPAAGIEASPAPPPDR